jgi:putative thioredoxin
MVSGMANASGSVAPAVIEVNDANFQQEVLIRSQQVPVVVDFWAPWCGPCRTLGPTLERLAAEAKGAWVLAKVNVDQNQQLAGMFQVQSIPAVKAVKDGRIVDEFVGALPEKQVREWLKRFIKDEGDQMLEMLVALEARDPADAAARYRLILGEQPENDTVMFRLGRLLLLEGDAEGAATLRQIPAASSHHSAAQALLSLADFLAIDPGDPTAEDSESRYRQAAEALRNQDYTVTLERLLAIVARDRAFRDDAARKAMLGVFALLGDEDPLVGVYRRKLANTLF